MVQISNWLRSQDMFENVKWRTILHYNNNNNNFLFTYIPIFYLFIFLSYVYLYALTYIHFILINFNLFFSLLWVIIHTFFYYTSLICFELILKIFWLILVFLSLTMSIIFSYYHYIIVFILFINCVRLAWRFDGTQYYKRRFYATGYTSWSIVCSQIRRKNLQK